jgi:hypothetical protein
MFLSKKSFFVFQEYSFNLVIIISYLLILLSILGLSTDAKTYLSDINYYTRIYICLFLIWRFNPFHNVDTFTNLDRQIAFSAGLFILTTTALNTLLVNFFEKIKHILQI